MNKSAVYVNKQMFTKLQQLGPVAVKGMSQIMQHFGDKIRDRAREYAPVDDYNLEKAIIKETRYDGINRRSTVSIYVDLTKSGKRQTVGGYAEAMHERLAIGLRREEALMQGYAFGLGDRSWKKDAGRGIVGGKFLTRAISDYKQEVLAAAKNRIRSDVRDAAKNGRLEIVR